jgi:multiple sugar transport system substrate-binding protein
MELTGIDVGSEQVPEQQQRQKQVIEFTSGGTSFDVTNVSWHVQKRLFGKGKWLEDLRPYLDNPALTPASFDFDDFSDAGITYATQADGRIDTLPAFIDYWIGTRSCSTPRALLTRRATTSCSRPRGRCTTRRTGSMAG